MSEEFKGVRIATAADTQNIYALLLKLWDENALVRLSPARALERIKACTEHTGGVAGVIDGPNGIEASVGLVLSQWWYSDVWHLEETWTFVDPEYRRSTHAKRLIEFEKWAARSMGVQLLTGIVTRKRLEPKMRLYQRQLQQVGALFMDSSTLPDICSQRVITPRNE